MIRSLLLLSSCKLRLQKKKLGRLDIISMGINYGVLNLTIAQIKYHVQSRRTEINEHLTWKLVCGRTIDDPCLSPLQSTSSKKRENAAVASPKGLFYPYSQSLMSVCCRTRFFQAFFGHLKKHGSKHGSGTMFGPCFVHRPNMDLR